MKLYELFAIETAGVGLVVPGVNTTADIGPNEISKQAKKLRFKVNKKGYAPVLRADGKIPTV